MGSLSFEGLGKSYGEVEVVRDVSLTIAEGEFVSLLGPSGCGKTTILRMVAGLVEPSRGRILIGSDSWYPENYRTLNEKRVQLIAVPAFIAACTMVSS